MKSTTYTQWSNCNYKPKFEKNHPYIYLYPSTLACNHTGKDCCIVLCTEDSNIQLIGVCIKDDQVSSNNGRYFNDWVVSINNWPEFHGTVTLEN